MAWIGNMIQNNNNSRALNDVKTAKTIVEEMLPNFRNSHIILLAMTKMYPVLKEH